MAEILAIYYWLHAVLPPREPLPPAEPYQGDRLMQMGPKPPADSIRVRTIPWGPNGPLNPAKEK